MIDIMVIHDKLEAKKILCDSEIYARISDKNSPPPEEFDFDMDGYFIGGYIDNKIISLMIYHKMENIWECHIQVLKEYRKKYADCFAEKSLNWFWDNVNVDKLIAKIPCKAINVIDFSLKHGFREIMRDGQDVYLQIERPQKWDL